MASSLSSTNCAEILIGFPHRPDVRTRWKYGTLLLFPLITMMVLPVPASDLEVFLVVVLSVEEYHTIFRATSGSAYRDMEQVLTCRPEPHVPRLYPPWPQVQHLTQKRVRLYMGQQGFARRVLNEFTKY